MTRKTSFSALTASLLQANSCPIARIEAERKMSPMAQLVRHTRQMPAFA